MTGSRSSYNPLLAGLLVDPQWTRWIYGHEHNVSTALPSTGIRSIPSFPSFLSLFPPLCSCQRERRGRFHTMAPRAMLLALAATCSAVQPPVDRGEQVAAIRRLEAQAGIMAPAAAKELKGGAAASDGSTTVLQPPVDRNEQVAAIRRLEAQTGIMAPAAAKEITGGARAEWGSSM